MILYVDSKNNRRIIAIKSDLDTDEKEDEMGRNANGIMIVDVIMCLTVFENF